MRKLKPDDQYITHFSTSLDVSHEDPSKTISTITYNPFYGIDIQEYSDASIEQKGIYIKSKCREAETVIATLSKMFEGEILNMTIEDLGISVACILKTNKSLTPKECGHILSISKNLQIT